MTNIDQELKQSIVSKLNEKKMNISGTALAMFIFGNKRGTKAKDTAV